MIEIKVPFLGDGVNQVTVCAWHHKVGDMVALGDDLAEIEADKAIFHLSCEHNGRLTKILAAPGAEALVGQTIAVLERV